MWISSSGVELCSRMRAVEDEGWDEEIEGRRGARNWEGK
jgi:hypothetical protein